MFLNGKIKLDKKISKRKKIILLYFDSRTNPRLYIKHLPNETKLCNYYSFDKETQVSQQRHLPQHVVLCVTSFLFLVSFPSLLLLQSLENSGSFPILSP